MKKIIFASVLGLSGNAMAAETVNITLLGTSDLHGTFVPWDYASDTENLAGSLSQIATQVKKVRAEQPNLHPGGRRRHHSGQLRRNLQA